MCDIFDVRFWLILSAYQRVVLSEFVHSLQRSALILQKWVNVDFVVLITEMNFMAAHTKNDDDKSLGHYIRAK